VNPVDGLQVDVQICRPERLEQQMENQETASKSTELGPWSGPTLRSTKPLPDPLPLCADCPAAWWYQAAGNLECFCTKFRSVMFDRRANVVTACDARIEAIDEAIEKARTAKG